MFTGVKPFFDNRRKVFRWAGVQACADTLKIPVVGVVLMPLAVIVAVAVFDAVVRCVISVAAPGLEGGVRAKAVAAAVGSAGRLESNRI